MNVLVIEQHARAQAMLTRVLEEAFRPLVVRCEKTLEPAKRTARRMHPLDIVLLNLAMPGCSGIEALTEFREGFPQVPVVAVRGKPDLQIIVPALKTGAAGYMPKNSSRVVMILGLRLVAAGGVFIPEEVADYTAAPDFRRLASALLASWRSERARRSNRPKGLAKITARQGPDVLEHHQGGGVLMRRPVGVETWQKRV